jgi:hypothetical protein
VVAAGLMLVSVWGQMLSGTWAMVGLSAEVGLVLFGMAIAELSVEAGLVLLGRNKRLPVSPSYILASGGL